MGISSVFPALEKLRGENGKEFEVHLGYRVSAGHSEVQSEILPQNGVMLDVKPTEPLAGCQQYLRNLA